MSKRVLVLVLALAGAAVALAAPACGGDDDGGGDPTATSPAGSPSGSTGDAVVDGMRATSYASDLTDGRFIGKADAPLKLEVFEDFQCPYCLRFTASMEPLLIEEYVKAGKVRIEFRHFVIIGAESQKAALGAQCAAAQDRFWEYHRALFLVQAEAGQHKTEKVNVGRFADAELERLAGQVGLDVAAWKTCYQAQATADVVAADIRAARAAGLGGTPGFILNGKAVSRVPGDAAGWRQILDAELKK